MLWLHATSERQRAGRDESGAEDETRAEQRTRREQSRRRDESRAKTRREQSRRGRSNSWGRAKTKREKEEDRRRSRAKTGRVPCNEREMREPEHVGKARSFIGSAQQQLDACVDCSPRARQERRASSVSNALTGAARAQLREARARAQHRLRGALQASGEQITRHVIMGAYTSILVMQIIKYI